MHIRKKITECNERPKRSKPTTRSDHRIVHNRHPNWRSNEPKSKNDSITNNTMKKNRKLHEQKEWNLCGPEPQVHPARHLEGPISMLLNDKNGSFFDFLDAWCLGRVPPEPAFVWPWCIKP